MTTQTARRAHAAPTRHAQIDQAIDHALAEHRLVGAVVLVAEHGHLVYRRAAGFADREAGLPMRENSVFRLASVTKPIIAAAVMRLVEQGRLALDAPVTRWLPYFTPRLPDGRTPTITLHHLLAHSAGLGYGFCETEDGVYHRLGISDGLDSPGITLQENLRRLAAAPLYFEPGSAWLYSLAYDVLGAVIEQATGQTLPQAVAALVTEPLQMRDTAFVAREPSRLAVPYADGSPAPQRMTATTAVPLTGTPDNIVHFAPHRALDAEAYPSGGAGMVGTAGDVLRLLEAVRRNDAGLLSAASRARIASLQAGAEARTQGPGWGFGYGGAVLADPAAAHTPQSPGTLQWGGVYGHHWFVDPARGLSVVALTNTTFEGMWGRFTTALRDAVYARPSAG